MRRNKVGVILLILVVIILTGFIREYLFEGINTYLYTLKLNRLNVEPIRLLGFLKLMSITQISILKFGLTLSFSLIYCLITALSIQKLVGTTAYNKTVITIFGGLFFLSFIIYLFSLLNTNSDAVYFVSRKIADIIQSPVALMILAPACWFDMKSNSKSAD